jgi:hypothetical protein
MSLFSDSQFPQTTSFFFTLENMFPGIVGHVWFSISERVHNKSFLSYYDVFIHIEQYICVSCIWRVIIMFSR